MARKRYAGARRSTERWVRRRRLPSLTFSKWMRSTVTGEHNRGGGSKRATRRCGDYVVGIEYIAGVPRGKYRCRIFLNGALVTTQIVGEPGVLARGVDHPISYDETARAAISFAVSEGQLDEHRLDYDDAGPRVQRGHARRRT